jgi:Secretion system C-terminal sorting domain/Cohesin domain
MSWGDVAAQGGAVSLSPFTDANGRQGVDVNWSGYSLPGNSIRAIKVGVVVAAGGCISPESITLINASKATSISSASITVTGSNPNAITVLLDGTFASPVVIPANGMTLFKCFYTSPIGSSGSSAIQFAPFVPSCRNSSNNSVSIIANVTPVLINTTGNITGTIFRADGQNCTGGNSTGLNAATVTVIPDELICATLSPATTAADGSYSIQVKRGIVGYDIKPTKSVTPAVGGNIYKCGLNSLDGPRISRHILGTEPFTQKWQFFTADFNSSRTITSFDIVLINQVRAQGSSFVPPAGVTSPWRFLDEAEYNSAAFGTLPIMTEIVFNKPIPEPSGSLLQNFVAIKRGNVDLISDGTDGVCIACNSSPLLKGESDDRNLESDIVTVGLSTDWEKMEAGDIVRIPIRVNDFKEIIGFSLGLQLDPKFLEIESVEMAELPLDWGSLAADKEENMARISWTGAKVGGYTLAPTAVLCYINAKVLQTTYPIDAMKIVMDSDFGSSLVDDNWEMSRFEWLESETDYELSDLGLKLSAVPNPFSDQITITYHQPVSGEANLRLVDINGREIARQQQQGVSGWHQWIVPEMGAYPAGIYACQLEVNGQTSVIKLLKQ